MSLSTKDQGLCIRAVEHQGAKYAISFLTFHNEINNIFFFVRKFFFRLVTSVGQRKNSDSPRGIEAQIFEFHTTRVLHTSKISNVDNVMFVHRIREMVSF